MTNTDKPRLPTKDGMKNAQKRLKEIYKQPPTPELVNIIKEISEQHEKNSNDKAAAKDAEI